jgi:hypothetical protein
MQKTPLFPSLVILPTLQPLCCFVNSDHRQGSEKVNEIGLLDMILLTNWRINIETYLILDAIMNNLFQFLMLRFKTVHYLGEKMCKRPDSSVGIAAERYLEGAGFESRPGCTFFSPCDIWRPTGDRDCI